ncbi:serine acetyltransferase [Dyadobacter pollutisoli]|jgi:serine O-acetyltransferase|uniref:Serine acetyltransferase n=1 Tax=Dyadobacter pollutisoli TaxID=2910158 RepID=A0A9E8NC16_9BACT|nr:DapH/DapD/GlmU-related protein [Dyadobacter pollutisoli]WAC13223.1 DapH/DapD/GlmU-related protein [Dyadobacter pollutisoli]
MILTRKDYNTFLAADAKAMDINYFSFKERLKAHITNPKWRFIKKLRRAEYYKNSKGPFAKLLFAYYYIVYKQYGMKLGFTIPMNVLGKGMSLPHYGTIVISKYAKIGDNARIHICVNIGASNGGAPVIGDNCYMGPGAKIFGAIKLGNNVKIGANSVVNKSFEEDNILLAGVPAKIVKRL